MDELLEVLPALVDKAGAAAVTSWLTPRALAACMLGDTRFAAAALELLRSPGSSPAHQVMSAFPEVAALAHPAPPQIEHEPGSDRPLLDHIATRMLGTKLAALEAGDRARWPGLSEAAFGSLAECARRVLAAGLGPAVRAAILHLDIAKTTNPILRAQWQSDGIALDVHNEAAAAILRRPTNPIEGGGPEARARMWNMPGAHAKLAIAWVEAHGLAGQHVRGECPIVMFAPLVGALRELSVQLARAVGVDARATIALALDGLHVLNACDTAAVREGLLDDALLAKLARVRDQLVVVANQAPFAEPFVALAALAPAIDRTELASRLCALRAGRQRAGEAAPAVAAAVTALGDGELAVLAPALATCQLWYCEAALSALSPSAHLRMLAAAVGAAHAAGVETHKPWHAQLRPLVGRLAGTSAEARYRVRLVETALGQRTVRELLAGDARLGPIGALSARLAAPAEPDAIVLDYAESAESAALVTLLGVYETRSSAAFHQMLKALCDLYGIRKDEFDRVSNEASYLATMNAAKSDKERMLEYVRPGKIVEVGPGGGIVLDLLEAHFPGSEVIGVDLSREVVQALEARAKANARRWHVVLGAAEALPELVCPGSVDTVVFCSILHEVYSYTEPKFQLASVERVIRAAFAALKPGGRIVIRDGIRPAAGTRRVTFLAPDARATFDLYVAQFEGRPIQFRDLAPDRVEMPAPDAMEFLYTYTWGPASFPYEVRELYGIMTYGDYLAALVRWCGGESAARIVELPPERRSYLQPGYRTGLAGKIALTDGDDRPVELPDSNCLIVIERR